MTEAIIHICGPRRDHECDDNGPIIYGKSDGTTTQDKNEKGIVWGSVVHLLIEALK